MTGEDLGVGLALRHLGERKDELLRHKKSEPGFWFYIVTQESGPLRVPIPRGRWLDREEHGRQLFEVLDAQRVVEHALVDRALGRRPGDKRRLVLCEMN